MYYRVSELSWEVVCPKRVSIAVGNRGLLDFSNKSKYMHEGTKLHNQYHKQIKGGWIKEYEFLSKLQSNYGKIYERFNEYIHLRGTPDEYIVKDNKVSIVEVKTTSKDRLYGYEYDVAVFQLQLYLWIMEPLIESIGYQLEDVHYVKVFSQKTRKQFKEIEVRRLENIEDILKLIVNRRVGQEKITYPKEWICKYCPKAIKEKCERYNDGRHRKVLYTDYWL